MTHRLAFAALVSLAVSVSASAPPQTALPNHLRDLQALRAEYPALITQAQAGELLGRLAFRLKAEGFGLLKKTGGNRCPVSGLSVTVSCDWIVHLPSGRGCDVLGSGPDDQAPGPSTPTWCAGEPFDTAQFVPVTADPGGRTSPPAPAPDDPRIAELQRQLAAAADARDRALRRVGELEEERDQLKAQIADKDRALDQARQELEQLRARPAPSCEAKVPPALKALGIRVGCRVIS